MSKESRSNWDQIKDLYFEALERPAGERARFLAGAGIAEDLIREVSAMLDASSDDRALQLERRLISDSSGPEESAEGASVGERIGSYRLERLIGRGGMGEVYLAGRDDDQFERTVAIKLLPGGRASGSIEARFQAERQILARLDHPHIAQLLDGGLTDDGLPYLIMQYVDGVPVTKYCDHRRLSVDQRLALFRTICSAVQYAHQNLVVHRDLKPSNILVTAQGEVKLLDFGIAKLLERDPAGRSANLTVTGEYLMTPEYAAPEQIAGESITTATDVYGLGVLLYELLTGQTPHNRKGKSRRELERMITTDEPVRPSQVIALTAERRDGADKSVSPSPIETAAARSIGPRELRRTIEGDLETIVMMALRPEPERRYSSATSLSDDIDRYLTDLPVHARRDTIGYRSAKFVRRHRAGVIAATIIAGLLLASSIVTTMQSRRITAERDRSEEVVGLLVDLFERSNPIMEPAGDTLRVRDFLEQSEGHVLAELEDRPELAARMKHVLGRIYGARGQLGRARTLLSQALAETRETGGTGAEEAAILADLARFELQAAGPAAEPLLRESLLLQRRVHGERHPAVAKAMSDLAMVIQDPEGQRRLVEDALQMRRHLLPDVHDDIASSLNQLASFHMNLQDYGTAADYFEESLDILRQIHGDNHPHICVVMQNLASAYLQMGQLDRAEGMTRSVVESQQRVLGKQVPEVATALNTLCTIQAARKDYPGAIQSLTDAIVIYESVYGPYHVHLANALRNLAWLHVFQNRHDEALQHFDRAIESQEGFDGNESLAMYHLKIHRASVELSTGDVQSIRVRLGSLLARLEELTPDGSRELADTRAALGRAHLLSGDAERAERAFREVLDFREPRMGGEHGWTGEAKAGIGMALAMQGRDTEGEHLLAEGYQIYRSFGYADPAWLEEMRVVLVSLLERLGRSDQVTAHSSEL